MDYNRRLPMHFQQTEEGKEIEIPFLEYRVIQNDIYVSPFF